jgi:3-oxoacyl-[acyl-carrier-protein] synthase-1
MQKVYITGIGMISAIGNSVPECLDALIHGRHGIGPITHTETIHKGVIPVGEVKLGNDDLFQYNHIENRGKRIFTRTALLGLAAAREALQSAGFKEKPANAGFISATSVGGMDRSENFIEQYYNNPSSGRLRNVAAHDCGDSTEAIAETIGATRIMSTVSTACSSSVNSLMYAAKLIKSGIVDVVIAGGADAITRFTINGFNTLMILDKQHCRPFDDTRSGLNLGEGAGYVVLESERSVQSRNARPLAVLSGYANANDAYHQTASSPEGHGATLAMKTAIAMSGLDLGQIGYINVHGTGTQNNDLSEGTAMKNIFGDHIPPFSSTKPFTGHTLGAAGGIEAVLSVLSINHGLVYPNLNFATPMNELPLIPNTSLIQGSTIDHVLSNSFGFGGNNSTAIFSKATL